MGHAGKKDGLNEITMGGGRERRFGELLISHLVLDIMLHSGVQLKEQACMSIYESHAVLI